MQGRLGRLAALTALASALLPALAAAQERSLTLDDIYDPEKKVDFSGKPPADLVWIDDTHYLWPKTDAKANTTELLKVEALTGRVEVLFDTAKMMEGTAEGLTPEDLKQLTRQRLDVFDERRTAFVLEVRGDLYHYDLLGRRLRRLTRTAAKEELPTLSPDGKRLAFVRGNDLFTMEVATQKERRLTSDGSVDVLNGRLDWVYQEEIYGRGTFRAYWWSPDSRRLAFLRLAEQAVPRYTLVDDIPYHPQVETYPYPKAGDPNPRVKLGVVAAAGGRPVWMDTARHGSDLLIVDVGWTPTSSDVVYQVQDREQTWLELGLAHPSSGRTRTVLRETTPAWVEPQGGPRWLKDGGFLWLSERSGFKHLYRYARDGGPPRALTGGPWEVRDIYGVDERGGWVYFAGTERGPLGVDLFRATLDGTGRQRLSQEDGTHEALFNPSLTLYIDTRSDVTTPPQVRLHRADGALVRVIDDNPVPALAQYRLARPEFVQVPTRDGFVMEAVLLKPPDFAPSRRYPVYQHAYGGPHAPQVRDKWGGTSYLFHQLLAQRGIVVWICDNRSASGKGAQSVWPVYKRLGEVELSDIEDGLAWLEREGVADTARIGISGWSYGGFMVSYALTHSRRFAMGIAGGPVTDWRDYDSIYTERYMLTPDRNAEGYRSTAPRSSASSLHGRLLLIHGAIDDNVHPQNTMQFAYELQKAGRPFRMLLYPKSRHGVSDAALVKHLRATMLDFIEETLLAPARAPATAGPSVPPPPPARPALPAARP